MSTAQPFSFGSIEDSVWQRLSIVCSRVCWYASPLILSCKSFVISFVLCSCVLPSTSHVKHLRPFLHPLPTPPRPLQSPLVTLCPSPHSMQCTAKPTPDALPSWRVASEHLEWYGHTANRPTAYQPTLYVYTHDIRTHTVHAVHMYVHTCTHTHTHTHKVYTFISPYK